jgi:glyoxylase-like metal-dependent hydrolase (beta-lactamase superfamily II)
MEVLEVAPGLRRWTARHEEWRQDVGCVQYEAPGALCLIDPLVPFDETERFWAALDRDVERHGSPVHVLITIYWHSRSAREVVERYGARLWAHARARVTVGRRAGEVTDAFEAGDPLPGGVEAFVARWSEVVYWLPEHRALVAGDAVLGAEGGGLRLCPESWTPRGGGHAKVRENLRPVLDLPVERVLVSHGEPVLEGGHEALVRLLGGP